MPFLHDDTMCDFLPFPGSIARMYPQPGQTLLPHGTGIKSLMRRMKNLSGAGIRRAVVYEVQAESDSAGTTVINGKHPVPYCPIAARHDRHSVHSPVDNDGRTRLLLGDLLHLTGRFRYLKDILEPLGG